MSAQNDLSVFEEAFPALVRVLAQSRWVTSVATKRALDASELAGEAAHGLLDLKESAARISNILLPDVLRGDNGEERLDELLNDIAEELRHIRYHIDDMRIFDYIKQAE